MPNLYSYALRVDDGAAPNPYGGVCTLTICKPAIRRKAEPGDWIVGLGPTKAPDGRNLARHVVYAMKVSRSMSFGDYYRHCQQHLTAKRPVWSRAAPFEHQVGDCLYQPIGGGRFKQLPGVHVPINQPIDEGGVNALLAEEVFYYFGDAAVPLPPPTPELDFGRICHPYRGHKVHVNNSIKAEVIAWMEGGFGCDRRPKILYGRPVHRENVDPGDSRATWDICGGQRAVRDDDDEGAIC